jgi:hypothetical protein
MKTNFMKLSVVVIIMAMFVATGCKKKKKESKKDSKVTVKKTKTGKVKKAKVKPVKTVKKIKEMFDAKAIDKLLSLKIKKNPLFAKFKVMVSPAVKACRKAGNSPTWSCSEWKKFTNLINETLKKVDKTKPQTIKDNMAIALVAAKFLKSENTDERRAALQIMEHVMYRNSEARVTKYREDIVRAVALTIKNDKVGENRAQAIRLIANDGGTSKFHGGEYDINLLKYALDKDKSWYNRDKAMSGLKDCTKKRKGNCYIKPSFVKKMFAKEKTDSVQQSLALLAANIGMKSEVVQWCVPKLMSNKFHMGCYHAYKKILTKNDFNSFLVLGEAYSKTENSKKSWVMCYVVELLWIGVKKHSWPKEKVLEFTLKILDRKETKTGNAECVTENSITGMMNNWKMDDKKELKVLQKIFKKQRKTYKKQLKKDRKDWIKNWDKNLKKIKASLKIAK